MEPYLVVVAGLGALVLLTAWLPMLLKRMPLSLPIVCVGIGALIFALPVPGDAPNPQAHLPLVERFSELVVIVALMGAGLKLDHQLTWASGRLTFLLLIVAMPLTILALALLGYAILGLGLASAILLAAALAPTDPVLASDIQVGPPGAGEEDEVRYTLTAEAGLNDGLAFPFVNLALALVLATDSGWFAKWALVDVLWKLAAGCAMGWFIGRGFGWLIFHLPNRTEVARTGDGFVALGATFLAYALTEFVHGYGFLAVFIAALRIRDAHRDHKYHERMHDFIEQLERLLMMVLLVIFGGMLVSGLLRAVTLEVVAYVCLALFIVRPLSAWLSMVASARPIGERAIIAFFGIRGLGSVYYLAYGLQRGKFDDPDLLWSVIGLTIMVSIMIHGMTVTPVMMWLDCRRSKKRR